MRKLLIALAVIALFAIPGLLAYAQSRPASPTVNATANPGEVRVSWEATEDSQWVYVGWIDRAEFDSITNAGRGWEDAIHFAIVPATFTAHTISGLKPDTEYFVAIGIHAADIRYAGRELRWSVEWSRVITTAAPQSSEPAPVPPRPAPSITPNQCLQDGTCLPIHTVGRVSGTGDSVSHVFALSPGVYIANLTGSTLTSAHLVPISPGDDIYYFDFIGRDEDSAREAITVDADDAERYLLEIDAGGNWTFTLTRVN